MTLSHYCHNADKCSFANTWLSAYVTSLVYNVIIVVKVDLLIMTWNIYRRVMEKFIYYCISSLANDISDMICSCMLFMLFCSNLRI